MKKFLYLSLQHKSQLILLRKIFIHFKFRVNQSIRLFNLNPRKSFPLVLLFIGSIFIELPYAYLYPLLSIVAVLAFHLNRKDIPFLKKVNLEYWKLIVILETSFIYLIFILSNRNYHLDFYSAFGFSILLLFPWIKPSQSKKWVLMWNKIPNDLFEWKSYLRKNSVLFCIVYSLLLASAYHPTTLIFGAFFIIEYVALMFNDNENKELLEMYFKQNTFKEKLNRNVRFYNLMLLPVYILYLILNHAEAWYVLYYLVFMNLFLLLIITRKYKVYHYKEKSGNYNMAVFIEYFFCCITVIPAFFIIIQNSKQAKENINSYVGN